MYFRSLLKFVYLLYIKLFLLEGLDFIFLDLLTEERYKTLYHSQILRKLNRIINSRPSQAADETDEANLLPNFPLNFIEVLNDFENLVTKSEPAKKQFVSLYINFGSSRI